MPADRVEMRMEHAYIYNSRLTAIEYEWLAGVLVHQRRLQQVADRFCPRSCEFIIHRPKYTSNIMKETWIKAGVPFTVRQRCSHYMIQFLCAVSHSAGTRRLIAVTGRLYTPCGMHVCVARVPSGYGTLPWEMRLQKSTYIISRLYACLHLQLQIVQAYISL